MGQLINGQWEAGWQLAHDKDGKFIRPDSPFRKVLGNTAEANRYHLYVSYACPWAHRTMIMRILKQLEDIITLDSVAPYMGEQGWAFDDAHPDHVNQARYLHEIYCRAKPDFTGKVTVPVLWDKKTNTIVNNESSEIIRCFNHAFNSLTGNDADYYPPALRKEIDAINATIYEYINNGVYRAGFAKTQSAYALACQQLFETLEALDARLNTVDFLVGHELTEADIRLYTTLVRFDLIYYSHFKCNIRQLRDFPNLYRYLKNLYAIPAFHLTTDFEQIKTHYYQSQTHLNPSGIVPLGPEIDL